MEGGRGKLDVWGSAYCITPQCPHLLYHQPAVSSAYCIAPPSVYRQPTLSPHLVCIVSLLYHLTPTVSICHCIIPCTVSPAGSLLYALCYVLYHPTYCIASPLYHSGGELPYVSLLHHPPAKLCGTMSLASGNYLLRSEDWETVSFGVWWDAEMGGRERRKYVKNRGLGW